MFFRRKKKEEVTTLNEILENKQLPTSYNIDRLVKIDNRDVIASLSSLTNVSSTLVTNKAMLNSNNQIKSSNLYKVKLPSGANLVNSREIPGNFRGFFRDMKHIRGHANLEHFNIDDVTKGTEIASKVAAVMSVSSLLVGQYYMN